MPIKNWKGVELPWVRIELNGITCCGEKAHPYYRFNANIPEDDERMRPKEAYTSVEEHARSWTERVKNYLKNSKCDAAAFYMGALTNLIADAAQFVHTTSKNELTGTAKRYRDSVHDWYELAVGGVTSRFNKRGEFFDIHTSFLASSIQPNLAIKLLAFDIHWDYAINYYDFFTMPYPSWVQPGPKDAAQLIVDYVNECHCTIRATEWSSSFKAEVQDHLNKAIEYSAGIINYFAQFWCKKCENYSNSKSQETSTGVSHQLSVMVLIILTLGLSNTLLGPLLQMLLYATAAP